MCCTLGFEQRLQRPRASAEGRACCHTCPRAPRERRGHTGAAPRPAHPPWSRASGRSVLPVLTTVPVLRLTDPMQLCSLSCGFAVKLVADPPPRAGANANVHQGCGLHPAVACAQGHQELPGLTLHSHHAPDSQKSLQIPGSLRPAPPHPQIAAGWAAALRAAGTPGCARVCAFPWLIELCYPGSAPVLRLLLERRRTGAQDSRAPDTLLRAQNRDTGSDPGRAQPHKPRERHMVADTGGDKHTASKETARGHPETGVPAVPLPLLPAHTRPGDADTARVLGSLPPTWRPGFKFQAPSFSLVQSWLL